MLTYLAQLLTPTKQVLDAEEQAVLNVAPGPNEWVASTDLWWLQSLTGHPCSLASLSLTCRAAQTRVRVWDPACADQEPDPCTPLELPTTGRFRLGPRNQYDASKRIRLPNNLTFSSTFQQRARHLRSLINAPEQPYSKALWKNWFDQSMLLTLEKNLEAVTITMGPIQDLISSSEPTE